MEISRWNDLADEHGFIVVYPSGTDIPKHWGEELDVKFISDLIDKLEAEYNIDLNRIYADGMSNGGGMAFALSCRVSDRIAAIGAWRLHNLCPGIALEFQGQCRRWRFMERPIQSPSTRAGLR